MDQRRPHLRRADDADSMAQQFPSGSRLHFQSVFLFHHFPDVGRLGRIFRPSEKEGKKHGKGRLVNGHN